VKTPQRGEVWLVDLGLAANSIKRDDGILADVPVISIFFGIVIRMYFREHEPKHFHAEHQAQEGKFDFDGNKSLGTSHRRTHLA
jgi:hypothetical protein